MAKIKGIVTRLVEADPQRRLPARIFFRPDDPSVFKTLDGASFTASGEIPVPADISGHKVGDEVELDVG